MKLNSGKWLEVLQSNSFQNFVKTGEELNSNDDKLTIAVACLLTFTQQNFTGPDIELADEFLQFADDSSMMMVDGIEYNVNMKLMNCLVTARNILQELFAANPENLVRKY